MPDLPTGVVTFLFTDIEGSTRLLGKLGDAYPAVLEEHARRIRASLRTHEGIEIATEGDSFFAVFTEPAAALNAAIDAQLALAEQTIPGGDTVKVRMGLHTGLGRLGGDSYAGIDVNRAARIAAAGHGGQVILSAATQTLIGDRLSPTITWRDLGSHRLKDLDQPEHLFQVLIPGLQTDFPPLRSMRPGNLPTSSTEFVGRSDLIGPLTDLIGRSQVVTLTGPGGTGKTRLSLEAGRRLADTFADGAFFVGLETIREPELVPSAISLALELTPNKDEETLRVLSNHLRERRLLLILDNLEQVLPAASIVGELAKAGPECRLLATSRVPLRIYGEQEFPVPPLTVPDPQHLPSLDELAGNEAVRLFMERARAVRPDLELTEESAAAIAELCVRLDGLPLAIELAAARARIFSPRAILSRLGEHLDLLSSGAVNLPERQRSLRGAIAWSYDLLEQPAQRLLERLAIFAGGASIDAAQAVCDPDHELLGDVLEGLDALVTSNLVRASVAGEEPRFSMLETIREFALEGLRSRGEHPVIGARHATWFADLLQGAEEALRTGRGGEFQRIETEYANVQAALRWTLDSDTAGPGLRICASIWRYWQREGLLAEGRWWTQALLGAASASARTRERAGALAALGSLAYWTNDAIGTGAAYEESLAIWRELGDELGIAIGTYNLAFAHLLKGEQQAALATMRESRQLFETLKDTFWVPEVLTSLGYTEILGGNRDEGEALVRSALPLISGDPVRQADMHAILAQVERMRGNFDAARDSVRAGLALLQQAWDATQAVGLCEVRSLVEIAAGNLESGLRLYAGATAMRQRVGGGPPLLLVAVGAEIEDARAALGHEEAERVETEGRSLTDNELIALAAAGVPDSLRRAG